MAVFKPFKALRPIPELASKIAALPYDVMNSEEAKEMVKNNPYSFLHVDKAEIDLPCCTDIYCNEVYCKAAENLKCSEENGYCKTDEAPCFYIYRQNRRKHKRCESVYRLCYYILKFSFFYLL